MKNYLILYVIVSTLILFCFALPVAIETNGVKDTKDAQDAEYYRYLTQIIDKLQEDKKFKTILENATDDEIKSGKILEHMDSIDHNIRKKLDEIKRMEIEYQLELVRQRQNHMMTKEKRNDWNPIHIQNKETFEKEDLEKLISKHHALMEETDKLRRKDFKVYVMEKQHKRRQMMKNMTVVEREEYIKKYNESHNKKHERMHAPGHKAQLVETWEKEDHLDPESFDEKTLFSLHDKNGDNYLDEYEMETLFLSELDKVYNESDPDTDLREREEELQRMREDMLNSTDHDHDGFISLEEFLGEKNDPDYEKDEEWKPIEEQDEYTNDEMDAYEKEHPDDEHYDEGHGGGHPDDVHNEQHPTTP